MNNSVNKMHYIIGSIIIVFAMFVSTKNAVAANKVNITKNIYTQNGELVFVHRGYNVSGVAGNHVQKISERNVPLGTRFLLGTSKFRLNDYVALGQSHPDGGISINVLDPVGKLSGKLDLPRLKVPILLNQSIVVIPKALHTIAIPHELEFYSLQGVLVNKIIDSDLMLMKFIPQPTGQLATINRGANANELVIKIYSPNGELLWSHSRVGEGFLDVRVTPNNKRIILFDQSTQDTNVSILDDNNQLIGQHTIKGVGELAVDEDSQKLAITAREGLFLINLTNGNTIWKKSDGIFALRGGIQFDMKSGSLIVLHAEVANSKHYSLHIQRFQLADGKAEKANIGTILKSDPSFQVIDISDDTKGSIHITFSSEHRSIHPNEWNKP